MLRALECNPWLSQSSWSHPLTLPQAGSGRRLGWRELGELAGGKVIKPTEELFSFCGEGDEGGKAALGFALQTLSVTSPL